MRQELAAAINRAVKDLYGIELEVELTRPEAQFGDYASNVSMQLAKRVDKAPRDIAESLIKELSGILGLRSIEIAGPGFLNFTLSDSGLMELIDAGASKSLKDKVVVAEYSDPNPFKPLHAGHLYTTLVGDMIVRLVENAGAKTIRLNFGGDVGLHVGKSMWSIIKYLDGEHPEKLDEIEEHERPSWLGQRYVEGNMAYETNEAAKTQIIEANKKVYQVIEADDHSSPFARIYWICRQWSYDYFERLYSELEIVPFDRFIPESEVTPLGVKTVEDQLKKGVFEKSDGAVVFDGERFDLHTRVFINSQGLPTYETKDVGLSLTKWHDYHFDKSIIITDFSQADYMKVVLAAIKQFAPKPAERTSHLTHGRVKLAGGVKISSRKGNGPSAMDIIESANEAGQESGTNPTDDTIISAIKYAFAKVRIGGDIVYDPVESIALEGNSGPYLQYAHARARSIINKVEAKNPTSHNIENAELEPSERSLARKIGEYSEVVELATVELMPHYICTYLYELAQEFNRFYEKNRVIDDPRQDIRFFLVSKYADKLKNGLSLLGINAPEKM